MRNGVFYFCLLGETIIQTLAGATFDFDDVRARAGVLAGQAFRPSTNRVPEALSRLKFIQYQNIHFNPEKALWRKEDLPFQVELFHPGWAHQQMVTLHEITSKGVEIIPFSSQLFLYGTNRLDLPDDLGPAGFRIIHSRKGFGEVAAFLGATYFRIIGRGQVYGTSARGLALDTGSAKGEEFPLFEEFWLRKPEKEDKTMTLFALMDSPSVTGAFQFIIRPGTSTVTSVKTTLFSRKPVERFGIAPLTSMFLHGENGHPVFSDFRPEVHDADGLLIETGQGEWIWHPLETGKMMRVNAFQDENPKGFGLMQRDRNFEDYQDLVARFQSRPNVWITPLGKWGKGAVELVQLPSSIEFSDNIVAFWVPANQPKTGQPVDLQYGIHWTKSEAGPAALGHVRSTRIGRVVEDPPLDPPHLRFVIDFGGESIESLPASVQLQAEIHYGPEAKFVADSIVKNEVNGTWRLVIEIIEPLHQAVDLRARLKRQEKPVTETWTFTWQP